MRGNHYQQCCLQRERVETILTERKVRDSVHATLLPGMPSTGEADFTISPIARRCFQRTTNDSSSIFLVTADYEMGTLHNAIENLLNEHDAAMH